MQSPGGFGHRLRVLVFVPLHEGVAGCLTSAGIIGPKSALNGSPDSGAVVGFGGHVGQPFPFGGTVIETTQTTIDVESETDGSTPVTLRDSDRDAISDDEIVAFGTLGADPTLVVHRSAGREPWAFAYMCLISAISGLLVLRRIARHWQFDADRLVFVPREDGDA